AAAILRARSFFIQILNEVLARHILRKLGLPITCALYIGGGKFTLLLPSSAKDRLSGMRAEMSKVVRQGIGLELVMAWTPLVPRDFQLPPETKNRNEQLPGIAIKLHDVLERELARQKMRKLSDLDEAELVKFFAPKGLGGRAEDSSSPTVVCNVCGREVPRTEIKLVEDVRFCRLCSELKDLGDQLKRARYLRLRAIEPQSLRTESPTLSELLRALGFALEVWTDPPAAPEPSAVVWGLVEPEADISLEKLCGPSQAAGRRFLANFVPLVKDEKELAEIREIFEKSKRVEEVEGLGVGDVKHFGILARQARGAPYIAVLRMDMDNLGRVFGLPPCPNDKNHVVRGLGRFVTLSRIATLSFFVSLFFEGWVEKIAKDMEKDGHDRLYAVYSGGDDLCFVGSWDAVFDFAYRVRRDFARFAAREDLGVSAGIYFCHEKYPLFLAARKADEAQERAKHLRDKKDALSFLGLEVGWEQFEGLQKRAEQLISFVREGRLPREVLRRVLELYEQYRRERDKRGEWGPWVWRAEYWLARFCERAKDEEVKTWVEGKMKAELGGERFSENTVVWALAARWAELATRR
ncbi:MAG: type III-A CRISPR-associated protein Cas10/Csm1, partial [Clostridia bacterium]|nr:type III-A CRISPR-associated protein Cas10/Csm1 [Clostridia bacterium]